MPPQAASDIAAAEMIANLVSLVIPAPTGFSFDRAVEIAPSRRSERFNTVSICPAKLTQMAVRPKGQFAEGQRESHTDFTDFHKFMRLDWE